jgi:hypothetical protein
VVKVVALPLTKLRMGVATLQVLSKEPSADDDVPDFPAPVSDLPTETPQITNGYVDVGDSETLRLWADMEGFGQSWEEITQACKAGEAGRRILTADQYRRVRNVVLFNREALATA